MAVMMAVTARHVMTVSSGVGVVKKTLTSVSAPELIFSDQEVGSLVIVPKSPDIRTVLQINYFFPTNEIVGMPHPIGSSLTQLISP